MNSRVYLDANATTCIDPELLERYAIYCRNVWGNPSSVHYEGQKARGALLEAKESIKSLLKAPSHYDVIFFSSATEAINTLIKGITASSKRKEGILLSTEVEHAAVFETIREIVSQGIESHFIPVGIGGAPRCHDIASYLEEEKKQILLAAFMAVNNETGIITHELDQIAKALQQKSIPLIVDGVALLGKGLPISFYEGISAYIFSGHKIHAPKGIAVALVDRRIPFQPLIVGGPQENKKRAGTENVPLALIFRDALKIAIEQQEKTYETLSSFQKLFESELITCFPDIIIHGKDAPFRASSTSNIAFPRLYGEDLLMALDIAGVSVSHGSACSSGALEPSRVLLKMGISREIASSSLRFSWSRCTTEDELKAGLLRIIQIVKSYTP